MVRQGSGCWFNTPGRPCWSQQLQGDPPCLKHWAPSNRQQLPEVGGHKVTGPAQLGRSQGAAGGEGPLGSVVAYPTPHLVGSGLGVWAMPGPGAAYLVSRSGPERLGKRLEAAECRWHIPPRGSTPAAGLQGTRRDGRSSGRPRWHRCRPGGTLGWPRQPHPRLQVLIRPLRAAASQEKEAERWRSA